MTLKNTIKEFGISLGDQECVLDRDYTRIAEQIKLLWGYPEFYRYLERLLVTEKERERGGFPLKVIQELGRLQEIHEYLFPDKKPDQNIVSGYGIMAK